VPNNKRIKRDVPPRAAPVRNRATGARGGGTRAADDGFTVGTVVDEGIRTAFRTVQANDATIRGAVERGVDTAYTVIEEYMLRGRQAAGRHHERKNGSSDMGDDRNYRRNGWTSGGDYPPLLEPWMQMMRMWTDSMAAFMPGPAGFPNPFAPRGSSSGAKATVSVQVASRQPAEVVVDIDPGYERATLTAEPLLHVERALGARIVDFTVECRDGHVRVHLSAADNQPGGTYEADLRGTDGVRRGTVRVDIQAVPVQAGRGGLRYPEGAAAKPPRARKAAKKSAPPATDAS
jgi:hypothetical protein